MAFDSAYVRNGYRLLVAFAACGPVLWSPSLPPVVPIVATQPVPFLVLMVTLVFAMGVAMVGVILGFWGALRAVRMLIPAWCLANIGGVFAGWVSVSRVIGDNLGGIASSALLIGVWLGSYVPTIEKGFREGVVMAPAKRRP